MPDPLKAAPVAESPWPQNGDTAQASGFAEWFANELAHERQQVLEILELKHDHLLAVLHQSLLTDREAAQSHQASEILASNCETLPEGMAREQHAEQSKSEACLSVEESLPTLPQQQQPKSKASKRSTGKSTPKSLKNKMVGGMSFTLIDSPEDGKPVVRGFAVESAEFELICGVIILLNAIVVALEMQYNGRDIGHDLGIAGYDKPTYQLSKFFGVVNVMFNVIFTLELGVRVYSLRCEALKSVWIWLDFVVVPISWLEILRVTKVNASIIRIFRLARTIRVVKIFRAMGTFRVLYFMIRTLAAGTPALIWSFVIIVAIQVCSALICIQMLTPYMEDISQGDEEDRFARERCFSYFGTFSNAMFTMFEVTDGNWIIPVRLLIRHVDPWWGLYFILYRCVLFFSIGKIVAAVFITETQRLVEHDKDMQSIKAKHKAQLFQASVVEMFQAMDTDDSMMISRRELEEIAGNREVQDYARHLELDAAHLDDLFDLLQSPDGFIHVEDFIKGLPKLKGPASSLELCALIQMVKALAKDVDALKARSMPSARPFVPIAGSACVSAI